MQWIDDCVDADPGPTLGQGCKSPDLAPQSLLPLPSQGLLGARSAERKWLGKYQLRAELRQVTDRTKDGRVSCHPPSPD